jgi:hypothetical protein
MQPSPIADAYVPASRLHERQELYPLDLHLCLECGHVQLLEVVPPEVLFGDYIYTTGISPGLVEHFRYYAQEALRRFAPPAGSLAVDIGSNDGTLLRFLQAGGLRVLGVDPAVQIARRATESGIETVASFFTSDLARQLKRHHGPAALVTANNVFAHADGLPDMADGVRELLAASGVFIFEVSYLADIVEKLLFDTVYHEHLCYHSVAPLDVFLARHGLELFDVQRLPSKGGSIRCFVQLAGGKHRRTSAVSDLLAFEVQLGLAAPQVFQQFTARLQTIKQELLSLVRKLHGQGQTIAGYGASATVTTLMSYFGLWPYLGYLVDDNPARHGLFSPVYHLPVHPPQTLYEQKPDCVLILAWQYAEPILKKNVRYVEQGGRFIRPLPTVQVIGDGAP